MQWNIRAKFLGTGTSLGVPVIGCGCKVCRSEDPRDRRLRCSVLLTCKPSDQSRPLMRVVIDATPDLRMQMLGAGVSGIEGLFFTHDHADHTHGLDDVRAFMIQNPTPIPAHLNRETYESIKTRFPYIQSPNPQYRGGLPLRLEFHIAEGGKSFQYQTLPVLPIRLLHGVSECLGLRIGNFAYLTDASGIPEESWPLLDGVETVAIDAIRERPHPTHFNFDQAIEQLDRMKAKTAYFVHLSHDHSHHEIEEFLRTRNRTNIYPCFDGLELDFSVEEEWFEKLVGG